VTTSCGAVNFNFSSTPKERVWKLENIFELFPPLKERAHHPGNRLSGDEQQMLALGGSLTTNPDLLLMDEPTEGLSLLYVQTVGDLVSRLKEREWHIPPVDRAEPSLCPETC